MMMMVMVLMMMMSCSADRKAADQSGSDPTDGRLRDSKDRWVELLPRRRQPLCGAQTSFSLKTKGLLTVLVWFRLVLNQSGTGPVWTC